MRAVLIKTFQLPIRLYRFAVSPLFGNACRFHPVCSSYALEALEKHGVIKGCALILFRLLRCNPWNRSASLDPVPERFAWSDFIRYKRRRA